MTFAASVNYEAFENYMLQAVARLRDPLPLLQRWVDIYRARRGEAWNKMTYQAQWPSGNVFMDTVLWPSPAPLDKGSDKEPWGGQPKKRGEGTRKGRLRASGSARRQGLVRRLRQLELDEVFLSSDRRQNGRAIRKIERQVSGPDALERYRVKPDSIYMVDTGRMRGEFLGQPAITPDHRGVFLSTNVSYAREQNKRAPFAFIAPIDKQDMDTQALGWFTQDVFPAVSL